MTFSRLLLENLWHHRRGNLAVLFGVVVGTAVLTGALLVGDSLRGSLRDLTEKQLGWVDVALVAPRFFSQEIAAKLPAQHASPMILLQAAAARHVEGGTAEMPIPKTVLLGVGPEFWIGAEWTPKDPRPLGEMPGQFWRQGEEDQDKSSVVLSAALARDLNAKVGDRVAFFLETISGAPRETFMGKRSTEEVVNTLTYTVKAILAADHFGSRFSLNPSPAMPRNAFLPRPVLQEELVGQQQLKKAHKRFPKAPVNVVLLRGANSGELPASLKKSMTLLDWGLELRKPVRKFGIPPPTYLSLESREIYIPHAVQQAVEKTGLKNSPTLVNLVNNMADLKHWWPALGFWLAPPGAAEITRPVLKDVVAAQVPYCIVAALDPTLDAPLGKFLPKGLSKLDDHEILLVDWKDSPLKNLPSGESYVTLTYFDPDQEGGLREKTTIFSVAGHLKIEGPTNDLFLTPEFPGITDSKSLTALGGWEPPFPFNRWLVSDADNKFWEEHRTTPKAYITLKRGKEIWGSKRFGDATSIRIAPEGKSPQEIEQLILDHLDPEQGGYRFLDLRSTGVKASGGSQEFGGLFLGFSCFLIVAALLLIGLLFRLNLDRRASEIGLLLAVGFRRGKVRWLLLAEGVLLAVVGAIVGSLVAIGYAQLLLEYLAARWPGGLDRTLFLHLHVTPVSMVIGYGGALLVSVLTIYWATRVLAKVAPRSLLAGETSSPESVARQRIRWVSLGLVAVGILGAAVCFYLGTQTRDHEMQAMSFLGSGALLLTAGLAGLWLWLHWGQFQAAARRGIPGLARLGMRNAARHPLRSLLTAGLLASATFLIVAVQAFHRDPSQDFLDRHGGSGGCALLAEAEVPIFENLNLKSDLGKFAANTDVKKQISQATFFPFRVKQGDDVSCLNLYRPSEPRLLGVPSGLIERGGFHFADTTATTGEEKENPWLLLNRELEEGVIPVFGEAETVTWILGSKLGGDITVTDGAGQKVRLRIVGLLQDSVFQSELLMSEKNFQKLFPRIEGFRFFLIEGPKNHLGDVKKALEKALADYGVVVTSSRERLETYLAVVNTYLATFQALGGLGLLLGALGLAVVLLRGVWERRGELALMRALGFRRSALGWLVLAENAYLLVVGLLIGTAAALLSVAPHLAGGTGVQWLPLAGLLIMVVLVGLLAGLLAVRATLRAPLLVALRKDY